MTDERPLPHTDPAFRLAQGIWAPADSGTRVAQRPGNDSDVDLLVVGTPGHPRALISPGRGLLRSFRAGNTLRSRRDRRRRTLAGAVAEAAARMPRDVGLISRLSVETDGPPVTQAIQLAAGLESSRCLVTVRPIDDHYKPTLTMLDDHGRASAYVKLGWTLGTADLVRVEASALQQVAGRLGPDLASPRVLAAGNDPWDRPFCATAPLPGSLRRSSRQLPSPRLMRDLAGPVTRVSADAILSGWDANPASSSRRHLVRAARSMLTRHWRDGVASGRAHGDWVPWNTATRNGRMVAWDWEHFRELAPLGLDALHWTVFSARSLDSCAWADAYAAALDSHDSSSVLPVERADRAALALYHATELLLKSERLRERGGVEPFPVDDIVADLLRRGAGGRSDG